MVESSWKTDRYGIEYTHPKSRFYITRRDLKNQTMKEWIEILKSEGVEKDEITKFTQLAKDVVKT